MKLLVDRKDNRNSAIEQRFEGRDFTHDQAVYVLPRK